MYFEGPEKKFDLCLPAHLPPLRKRSLRFWERLVQASDASIVSSIHSSHCDAHLLSESSLFVFDHRVVMITCGQTALVKALAFLAHELGSENLQNFTYARKRENFPHLQPQTFGEDVTLLRKFSSGQVGHINTGHLNGIDYFVASDIPSCDGIGHHVQGFDKLELLMHNLAPEVRQFLAAPASRSLISSSAQLKQYFAGFECDEFFFSPSGYSLNALCGSSYFTIHITPEELGSYISFECGSPGLELDIGSLVSSLLNLYQPGYADLILHSRRASEKSKSDICEEGKVLGSYSSEPSCTLSLNSAQEIQAWRLVREEATDLQAIWPNQEIGASIRSSKNLVELR